MMDVATDLLNRVKQEYLEMPGLLLTARQAGRLWNLDASVCQALLSTLVDQNFLSQTPGGAYLRCAGEDERSRRHASGTEAPLRGPNDGDEVTPAEDPTVTDRTVPPSPSPDDTLLTVDALRPA